MSWSDEIDPALLQAHEIDVRFVGCNERRQHQKLRLKRKLARREHTDTGIKGIDPLPNELTSSRRMPIRNS